MTTERAPCVYILAKAYHGTLYTGVTSNLVGRVIQHREGTFDGFTKRYDIHRLVYYETGETMEAASCAKSRSSDGGANKYNLIERLNPEWNDLAVGLCLSPLT